MMSQKSVLTDGATSFFGKKLFLSFPLAPNNGDSSEGLAQILELGRLGHAPYISVRDNTVLNFWPEGHWSR